MTSSSLSQFLLIYLSSWLRRLFMSSLNDPPGLEMEWGRSEESWNHFDGRTDLQIRFKWWWKKNGVRHSLSIRNGSYYRTMKKFENEDTGFVIVNVWLSPLLLHIIMLCSKALFPFSILITCHAIIFGLMLFLSPSSYHLLKIS
jgi:hypothetical protein